MWAYGRGQTHRQTHTDTQTRVTIIHFSWSTTHAKCNNNNSNRNINNKIILGLNPRDICTGSLAVRAAVQISRGFKPKMIFAVFLCNYCALTLFVKLQSFFVHL